MAVRSAATLVVDIVTDTRKAQQDLTKTADSAGKFKARLGVASKAAAGVFAAVAAGAIVAGNAAADDAKAQALLANTMKRNAGASNAAIAANEEWIASLSSATGVADDDLRPALASLVTGTKDVATAQSALKTAMDVSAATGKPLQTVADAISKGYGGNAKALGKLVPGMDKAAVKAGDMSKIMDQLAQKTGGAAAAAADTAAGKMQKAKNAMNEAQESIGAGLLPVMAVLATLLGQVGAFAQQHATAFQVLAVAIAAVAGAVLLINAAFKVYQATLLVVKAVQTATFLTNPVFLVILAIVALIAIVVLLVKNWDKVRAAASAAWSFVKAGAMAVWDWIKSHWPLLLTILFGPIGLAVSLIVKNFDKIKAAAGVVVSFVKTAWSTLWSGIKSGASDVVAALKAGWRTLENVLTAPFDALHSAVDRALGIVQSLIDKIKGIKLPHIPGLSSIIPGPFAAAAPAVPGARSFAATPAMSTTSAGGWTINVYGVLDGTDAARKIRTVLREDDRHRNGVRVQGAR